MKKSLSSYLAIAVLAVGVFIDNPNSLAVEPLVLVADGKSVAPIVLFEDAPPLTRLAAEDLADYMEKITGARPELLEGRPEPLPEHAIWVGYQPVLEELFPGTDFDFEHPEEILIEANGNHLVIVGRDRWDVETMNIETARRTIEGVQQEYGTANAVYTFLQDFLEVRWFWPGEWGEDIIERDTIAFEPFVYRYHPQVRGRMGLFAYSTLFRGARDWMRYQRLQLDSLGDVGGGHGFGTWWNRFHEEHPDWFALQPDGTRSGFPKPGTVKMCMSNPEVWEQWIRDVEAELEANPNQKVFNASPNDGYNQGHCICANCLAWDHPEGQPRRLMWEGIVQDYVALSDRDVTFANHVGRLLKERFPDQELYVYMLAYGHSRPAPVEAVPDDNVIIGNVANFLLRSDMEDRDSLTGETHREQFAAWGEITDNNFWRPNVGSEVGWQHGLPDLSMRRTMEDMRHAADNGWMGIYVDYNREHWATQTPKNYLMTQLTWNPDLDGEEILADFYERAYGPAAEEMEAYWTYLEELREAFIEEHGYGGRGRMSIPEYYTPEKLAQAEALLEAAMETALDGPEIYQRRIEFAGVGLEYTQLLLECGLLTPVVNRGEDETGELRERIMTNWARIRELQEGYPNAMRWQQIFAGGRGDGPPTLSGYYPGD